MHCCWSVISVWKIRKSQAEPGQVSRVAEESQLCSHWPKSHELVAMHELAHCHDGGTRSFFSWHFLLDISALWDNTSNSPFAPDIRIHDAQHFRCQKRTVNMTFMLMHISHLEYRKTRSTRTWTNSSRAMTNHSRMMQQKGW
jgi:hypothetical protein